MGGAQRSHPPTVHPQEPETQDAIRKDQAKEMDVMRKMDEMEKLEELQGEAPRSETTVLYCWEGSGAVCQAQGYPLSPVRGPWTQRWATTLR